MVESGCLNLAVESGCLNLAFMLAHCFACKRAAGQDLKQLEMLEGQLTWLVHIIGSVVKGRMNSSGALPARYAACLVKPLCVPSSHPAPVV
jgi:hypothetical protein